MTIYAEFTENDVFTVVLGFANDEYLMWQLELSEAVGSEDGIYFEYNSQKNGGYDTVKECTISNDGIHLVLENGQLLHFYFTNKFSQFSELKRGLNKIYRGQQNVLEFHY